MDTCGYVLLFNIDFFLNNAFPKHLISNKKVLKNSIDPTGDLNNDFFVQPTRIRLYLLKCRIDHSSTQFLPCYFQLGL